MSTSGRSYVQRVPASVAARLAGVRAVSSFFITSMVITCLEPVRNGSLKKLTSLTTYRAITKYVRLVSTGRPKSAAVKDVGIDIDIADLFGQKYRYRLCRYRPTTNTRRSKLQNSVQSVINGRCCEEIIITPKFIVGQQINRVNIMNATNN